MDARVAKRALDTNIDQAPLVIALGPGFTAGVDCHAVVETMRGHHLGRVLVDRLGGPQHRSSGPGGGSLCRAGDPGDPSRTASSGRWTSVIWW